MHPFMKPFEELCIVLSPLCLLLKGDGVHYTCLLLRRHFSAYRSIIHYARLVLLQPL